LVAVIMSSLAEYERTLIRERAAAAREAAVAAGRQTGRPRVLTPEQSELARRMRESGEAIRTIAETLSVSRATIYRAIGEAA
jgi:DNA invertase Pin-like site-specific DNA recombinase